MRGTQEKASYAARRHAPAWAENLPDYPCPGKSPSLLSGHSQQLLSFFVTSSDLFIATKIGVDAQDTINISDGMGAVVFIMWFGFVIQGLS